MPVPPAELAASIHDGPCNYRTFNANDKRIAELAARFGKFDLWTGAALPAEVKTEFKQIKSSKHGGYAPREI
jgi:hypothetical protein